MSTSTSSSNSGYEFNAEQNRTIGDLARKMSLVGIVIVMFGVLQMVNGIASLIVSRNPAKLVAAAKEAGVSADQIEQLQKVMGDGDWLSPFTVATIATALAGLLLLVVGVWTGQAAGGFAMVVRTQGQDIPRLMGALEALRKKYSLMYTLILIAAIASLVSLGISLWHLWKG